MGISTTYYKFIMIVLYCSVVCLKGKEPQRITFIGTMESKNSFISFVEINGKKYLVKQKKIFKSQLATVRDALAAYVAKELHIAHQVKIISPNENFLGKARQTWPATLHTIAKGNIVRLQRNSIYCTLRLKQRWAHTEIFEEKGLTPIIIEHMTWHPQLAVVVALDLMVGNSDRHTGNLCYDPETDTFCAIDMDDSFNKDLCELAIQKLEWIIYKQHHTFTIKEIGALIILRKTLRFLLHQHTPASVIRKLHEFAQEAGFCPGNNILYSQRIQKRLVRYEEMIQSTFHSARKLITLLSYIIKKGAKRAGEQKCL